MSERDVRGLPVTIDDVRAAATTIEGAVVRTPSSASQTLSEILGCNVVLKFEGFQFTAAYKERGARNRLAALTDDERKAGVVAVSAGNHAQAVARHAALLDIPATIVMPHSTPFVKVMRTQHLGAEVEMSGEDLAEAMARGLELVSKGRTLIHPYDDRLVIAGQGTVGLELLTDHVDLDMIVVPVGGGGLISGIAVVAAAMAPHVEIVGVQSEVYPGMVNALADTGAPRGGTTMAEGIAVTTPGNIAQEILRALHVDVVTVPESAIEDAVALVVDIEKVIIEGAAAAAVAAIATDRQRFAGKRVGVILTGANIDPRLLASVIERGLVRAGRLARLRVALDDRPGALAALLTVVGDAGANLLEVQHQRLFADIPLRAADVDLVIECLDATHRDQVVETLNRAGYRAKLLPLDG